MVEPIIFHRGWEFANFRKNIISKIPEIDMTYHVINRFYMISWLYLYRGASWDQGGFIQDSDRNGSSQDQQIAYGHSPFYSWVNQLVRPCSIATLYVYQAGYSTVAGKSRTK